MTETAASPSPRDDIETAEGRKAIRRDVISRRRLMKSAAVAAPLVASLPPSPARARLSHASAFSSQLLKKKNPPAPTA